MQAIRRNQAETIEGIAPVILHFSRSNYVEFFNFHLKKHFTGDQQRLNYMSTVHDLVMVVAGSNLFHDSLVASGVIDDLVSQAIRMADFDQNGANTTRERIAAMAFLADLWEIKADKIEENHEVA